MNKNKIILADKPWIKNAGLLLAFISFSVTIYVSFFYQKSYKLEYEILSNTSILNKNVELSSLSIIVDSVNIQKSNLNISIIELCVSNKGKNHLRRNDYDEGDFGIMLENAILIEEPEFMYGSTSHIRNCLVKHNFWKDSSFVNIPIIPLDSHDFYNIKMVILHDSYDSVDLIPYGKIIGQKEILVIDADHVEEGLIYKVLYGSVGIHILRFFFYIIIFISLLFVIVYISDKRESIKKRRLIKNAYSNKDIDKDVIDDYDNFGLRFVMDIFHLLNLNERELFRKYQSSNNYTQKEGNKRNKKQWEFHKDRTEIFNHMLKKQYVVINGDQITIDRKKRKSLEKLHELLRIKGMLVSDYSSYKISPEFEMLNV